MCSDCVIPVVDLKFPEKHQPAMATPVDILHNLHGVIHFMLAKKKCNLITRIFIREKKKLKLAMGHQCLKCAPYDACILPGCTGNGLHWNWKSQEWRKLNPTNRIHWKKFYH